MSLPPFLVPGDEFDLHVLSAHGEERWWWTRGGERALDFCLAAALGRRWPMHAAAARCARIARSPRPAGWVSGVSAFLREAGVTARGLVSQLGTPGHYRKHAALVLDGRREVAAILKCSEAPASRASIRAEAAALSALAGRVPAELPRALGCVETAGRVLSLQTPLRGRRSSGWTPEHHELALALLRAGGGSWSDALASRERIRDELAACGGPAARVAATCGRLLDAAEPALRDLPLGWTHRDFTPANVWRDRRGLAVIDWEWADPAWAPGHDLIHFHLFDPLRRGDDAAQVLADLAAPGSALARYARAADLGRRVEALLGLYLYDLILFYAAANGEGVARCAAHPVIARACAVADNLLRLQPHAAAPTIASKVQTLRE